MVLIVSKTWHEVPQSFLEATFYYMHSFLSFDRKIFPLAFFGISFMKVTPPEIITNSRSITLHHRSGK